MADQPDIELSDYKPALGPQIEAPADPLKKTRVMTDTVRRRLRRGAVSITTDLQKETYEQVKQLLADVETVLQVRMPLCRVFDLIVRCGLDGARRSMKVPKNPPARREPKRRVRSTKENRP